MKKIWMIAIMLVVLVGIGFLAPGLYTQAQSAPGEGVAASGAGDAVSVAAPVAAPVAGMADPEMATEGRTAVVAASQYSGALTKTDTELYMHIGSPVALANGKLLSLDKDSPDLAPVIYKTRTLVPLRVISEYFGAEVGYDAAASQATIRTADHEAVFPVGKNYYFLDGVQKTLDVETILISGRAFVPLREICQETLGYTVDYRDSLICVARAARLTDKSILDVKSKIGMYVRAADLDALTSYMNTYQDYGYWRGMEDVIDVETPMLDVPMMDKEAPQAMTDRSESGAGNSASSSAPSAPQPNESLSTSGADGAYDGGYSTTNVQVEGIDEGDIVKTDGKYIYIIADSYLRVVEAQSMTLAGGFDLGAQSWAQEMYIDGDRVTIIGSRYEERTYRPSPRTVFESEAMPALDVIYEDYAYYGGASFTFVRVLDTRDMAAIKSVRYYEVEGSMNTSRKKGDYVYLVSSFSRWYRGGYSDVRPLAGENSTLAPLPVEKIMIMPGGYGEGFLTLSAVNTKDVSDKVTSETIAGSGYVTHMSNDNLYIAVHDSRYSDKETMNIARFSIDGSKIGYAGSGRIEGGIDDQFSMDEYEGHLRVATTVRWPRTYNNLYVMDANMDIAGQVSGYAEGERIYSARFMGTRGYVVTFRQTDPLFVFDLSNPASPKITGELKVPGFSSYLHPVSQNVILGVGRDVYDIYRMDRDGNQVVVGQNTGGVKISLFDVSDMGKPKELDTLVLGDYGYTELLDNHRAAMFKNSDNLLGFCGYSGDDRRGYFEGAFLISYAGDKLSEAGRLEYRNPYDWYILDANILYTGERLAYIGDTLYFLQDGLLRSFDLRTLAPKGSLRLTADR